MSALLDLHNIWIGLACGTTYWFGYWIGKRSRS